MLLSVSHETVYHYPDSVSGMVQQMRLTPLDGPGQRVLSWTVDIEGGTREFDYVDNNGNRVALVSTPGGTERISIRASGQVETTDQNGIIGETDDTMPLWCYQRQTPLTGAGDGVRSLLGGLAASEVTPGDLHNLSRRIIDRVPYIGGRTDATTDAEQALDIGAGVCQDHAHIFIAAARSVGIPARYVSGYLMLNDRVEQEASHAWAEAWLDGLGWVGFDVSNRISPDERYIRLATGLDYRDAAPVRGVRFGDTPETLIVSLQVQQ